MKKIKFLIVLILISIKGFSQPYPDTTLLFDLSEISELTTFVFDAHPNVLQYPKIGNNYGSQIEFYSPFYSADIIFTDPIGCADAKLDIGFGMTDSIPFYPSSISGWDLPIVLDTALTRSIDAKPLYRPYRTEGFWIISINVPDWRWYDIYYTVDPSTCTEGKFYSIR